VNVTGDAMTGTLTIAVPTTTSEALILKTTDDNATKNLQEWQKSDSTVLANVDASGYIHSDRFYLNSTAYLSGATAGVIEAKLSTDSLASSANGFIYDASTGHVILQSYGFALGESAGSWNGNTTGLLSVRANTTGAAVTNLGNGMYMYFYVYADNNAAGVVNAIYGQTDGYALGNGSTWGWANAVTGKTGGSHAVDTGLIVNAVSFHAMFELAANRPNATNIYGLYVDSPDLATNRYGIYINDFSGGTLNYAIYTNVGAVRFGDKVIFTQTDGNEYIDSLNDGYMDYGATTLHRFDNPLTIANIKSGATQAGAGAAANELWKTASHATLPDNVVMIGV